MTAMLDRVKLAIIIPVYNCEAFLKELTARLVETLEQILDVPDFEIWLVDDRSSDGSWTVTQQICELEPRIKGVRLTRNFGQHHAITAGIDLAAAEWVVVMDGDLQDSPELISSLWSTAQEGYDIVDVRRASRHDPLWRRASAWAFHVVFRWLSGVAYDPRIANYRIMSNNVVEAFRLMPETARNFGAQLEWLGFQRTNIDIDRQRREGPSSYSIKKLLQLAFDTAIAYSNRPLRLAVFGGLGIAVVSAVFTTWVAIRALVWGIPVDGWASLMASVWFLGGAVIATVGVVGIYVGRVYDEAKGRPLYVVSEKLNC